MGTMLPDLRERAREMRNLPGEPEKRVWAHLSRSQLGGLKFRRQVVITPYIVDFLCPSKALIVEIDGDTHEFAYDVRRDATLAKRGFTTLRFSNQQVMRELEAVLETILSKATALPQRWPHPNPSPEGEGL